MGAFLSHPKTNKENESGAINGLVFSTAAMQGWRTEMEVRRFYERKPIWRMGWHE